VAANDDHLMVYDSEMSSSVKRTKVTKVEQTQEPAAELEQTQAKKTKIIPVLKPITETITFKDADEFNEYYSLHREEMDVLGTCKLNKMYLVPEFKITRLKGVLSLKLLTPSKVNHTIKLNDQEARITELERKIIRLRDFIVDQFDSNAEQELD
jgi:hypothetical protein